MDLTFLPKHYVDFINLFGVDKLYEIRIRLGFPLKINYNNKFYTSNNKFICTSFDINHIISLTTEKSVYAYNDFIKQGYITTKNGIRIGLSGECVFEGENIITIKNFTSLNVRIPHEIKDCSKEIFPYVCTESLLSTLIISPPFYGKTTILKDLTRKLNETNKFSILLVDERGEFEKINGENVDKIKYSNKKYAFSYGIRSLSPHVIITDELSGENDWFCVKNAIFSGVKVIASCHGKDLEEIKSKDYFIKVFDRYVVLNDKGQADNEIKFYDGEFNLL